MASRRKPKPTPEQRARLDATILLARSDPATYRGVRAGIAKITTPKPAAQIFACEDAIWDAIGEYALATLDLKFNEIGQRLTPEQIASLGRAVAKLTPKK